MGIIFCWFYSVFNDVGPIKWIAEDSIKSFECLTLNIEQKKGKNNSSSKGFKTNQNYMKLINHDHIISRQSFSQIWWWSFKNIMISTRY